MRWAVAWAQPSRQVHQSHGGLTWITAVGFATAFRAGVEERPPQQRITLDRTDRLPYAKDRGQGIPLGWA